MYLKFRGGLYRNLHRRFFLQEADSLAHCSFLFWDHKPQISCQATGISPGAPLFEAGTPAALQRNSKTAPHGLHTSAEPCMASVAQFEAIAAGFDSISAMLEEILCRGPDL